MLSKVLHPQSKNSFQKGRYQVLSVLGKGSIGTVYKVCDRDLDGQVLALKVLHAHLVGEEKTLSRFRDQVLISRQLSHKNIIKLYDFERESHDVYFVTMEHVDGCSLESLLDGKNAARLSQAEILTLLSDLATGLSYAHSRDIIHRDLKPSNILISRTGELKVADFGLSKSLESSFGLTQTGEIIGSPSYMAPERFRAETVDARADVYSFGILTYQILFGRLPFESNNYLDQARSHLHQPLEFPDADYFIRREIPLWYQEFIEGCCAKLLADRFGSAKVILEHLEKKQDELRVETVPCYTFLQGINRRQNRWPRLFRALTLAILLIVLIGVSAIQTNTRRFMGTYLLRTERFLGVDLVPLKALFRIHVSLSHPEQLFKTIAEGDPANANLYAYLNAGGEKNIRDNVGDTFFHYAVQAPDTSDMYLLSRFGFDLNQRNYRGETALLKAIRWQQFDPVTHLIFHRANPNICDYERACPIHVAYERRDRPLVSMLLEARADLTRKDKTGSTILHLAAKELDIEFLWMLATKAQEALFDVDVRNSAGLTPLMIVAQNSGDKERKLIAIASLFAAGASIDARDDQGYTALDHARQVNDNDAYAALQKHASTPNQENWMQSQGTAE